MIRITSSTKELLYTNISITTQDVQWNTLVRQAGLFDFPFYDCANTTGYSIQLDNFSIMDREYQGVIRILKDAMFIRVHDPSLTRNPGKYQLPHIWDQVLQDMPALCLQWYPTSSFNVSRIPLIRECMHILISMVLPGVPSPPYLSPICILVPNFPAKFWHQKGWAA